MKIGVFGGAFDPPHTGHLIIAEGVRDTLNLDQILFIPYSTGPHRPGGPVADPRHRLKMLELSVADHEAFILDDREVRRGGLSYMVETLHSLRDELTDCDLYLIVGSDQLEIFQDWREWKTVLELCTVTVIERPGFQVKGEPAELMDNMVKVQLPLLLLSSTMIRERVQSGRSIRYLVPDAVAGYIQENRLYRENNTEKVH